MKSDCCNAKVEWNTQDYRATEPECSKCQERCTPRPVNYSAKVDMYLENDNRSIRLEVAGCLENTITLREPATIAPCEADFVIVIDGKETRKRVRLACSTESERVTFEHVTKEGDISACCNWPIKNKYGELVCGQCNEVPCTHKPELNHGPIGQYHCPECGEMVVAGAPHPDYSILTDPPPIKINGDKFQSGEGLPGCRCNDPNHINNGIETYCDNCGDDIPEHRGRWLRDHEEFLPCKIYHIPGSDLNVSAQYMKELEKANKQLNDQISIERMYSSPAEDELRDGLVMAEARVKELEAKCEGYLHAAVSVGSKVSELEIANSDLASGLKMYKELWKSVENERNKVKCALRDANLKLAAFTEMTGEGEQIRELRDWLATWKESHALAVKENIALKTEIETHKRRTWSESDWVTKAEHDRVKAEVERLKEIEWMYEDLCK